MALELSSATWKLAFTVGLGQKPRLKTVTARSTVGLLFEIKAAKKRFGLPEDAPVLSCYEAGRDGFWLHRFLLANGVQNQVVDSASIDAVKLVEMLIRWHNGERKVWKLVRVPSVAEEDQRQLHRESIELKSERTAVSNSIKGLLATLGRFSDALHAPRLSPPLPPLRKGGKVGGAWPFFPRCEGGTQGGASSAFALCQVRHPRDRKPL